MQIRSIKFSNFKQFASFSVSCKEMNALVGPNNAGKSTTLDAIRLCNDVLRYARRRRPLHASHDEHGVCPTYLIELSLISINVLHVVRNYGDDPAEVVFTHMNGNVLVIKVHPSRPVIAFIKSDGAIIRDSSSFRKAFPLDIVVVPTLGPLELREVYVTDDTVDKNKNTRLAHRTFRNILFRKSPDEFQDFARLVANAWGNVEVSRPEIIRDPDAVVEMFFIEERMTREVSTSGFGFQVWMQMMLQVMRGSPETVLVLDEPDIYLHPDLQRKLLRLVRERFGQIFIATHSTEIINDLNAGDILSVDSKRANARRITSEDGYRDVFNYIGSSENSEFARMARARRIVFFEGKDKRILRKFAQKVSKSDMLEDPDTVYLQAGGFGQWRRVKEVGWTLSNVFGMNVRIAALFDRDYRCDGEVDQFIRDINSDGIRCRVLARKEIENYALEYEAMIRLIVKKTLRSHYEIEESEARSIISKIIDGMESTVKAQIVGNIFQFRKRQDPRIHDTTILGGAMGAFDEVWANREQRLWLIPGKEFISVLSATLHERSGQSITINQIVGEMKPNEVSADLVDIIGDIEGFFAN